MLITSGKRELKIDPPWMNAAGALGFSDESASEVEFSQLGAFVTHPMSRSPRRAASGERLLDIPGGFLLHTGLPNPGLTAAIREHQPRWRRMSIPVIVHLIAEDPADLHQMLLQLEAVDSISGVEVGLASNDPLQMGRILAPVSKSEIPVIARVSLEAGLPGVLAAVEAGAAAVTLVPPRGAANHLGKLMSGRLLGPAVLPMMLEWMSNTAGHVKLPLIASGGIRSRSDISAMLEAGAAGVQVDFALWTHPQGWFASDETTEDIRPRAV
jgi:dihydroorotate dehydrogenase